MESSTLVEHSKIFYNFLENAGTFGKLLEHFGIFLKIFEDFRKYLLNIVEHFFKVLKLFQNSPEKSHFVKFQLVECSKIFWYILENILELNRTFAKLWKFKEISVFF